MPRAAAISLSLAEIAARLGGDVLGDGETRIHRVAPLPTAGAGDISFLSNPKFAGALATTAASALILTPAAADGFSGARIITANPYAYYARVTALLNPVHVGFSGIDASAVLRSPVPASCKIGPHVTIGKSVVIGENVVLHAGCVIGDGASIGDDSLLHPNVTIYHDCRVGKRAIIHAGTVIGSDGFGFAPDGKDWIKIPQIGRVIVGDDVEFGANCAVDRGALEDTVIGDGCKLDNQVHIAHNCKIGARTVLAGCVGIAGSTTLGEHCIVGGGSLISGHIELAPDTMISGGTTVIKSIRKSGVYTSVFPLDEHEDWIRNASHIRRLSKMADKISELEKKLKEIETRG